MLGYQDVPGIMVLTIRDMFETIKNVKDKEYNIIVSYVEIYNETIRDLLVPSSSYLELRDDPIKGVTIAGVTEHNAESTEQIMNLLFLGNKRRTTEATNANQTSSRSHAVFQIVVTTSPRTKNTSVETLTGKLSLIDLAGSERGTVTENRGIRLREGAKINRSLLALANCINALGDKSKKGFFVNYRDSKLTRLLKDSLGGNCKTVMIANISPAGNQIEETINTLKYANRAKNIKTKVMSNKKMVSLHIAEYKNIINDLRQEIEDLKSKLHDPKENGPPFQPMANNFMKGNLDASKDTERENKDCPCWCGRSEDDIDMKKIQEEIFENFQQRIQLRRALMELEEQNAMNILEMRKRKAEIMVWEKNENSSSQSQLEGVTTGEETDNPEKRKRPLSALPKEVQANYKNIQTLRASTDRNTMTRDALNYQLQENIDEAKKIRDAIPKRIRHQDKREYLELIIKNHVLELQNIELEIHLKIQEKIIDDLKNIVTGQRKIINDNKLEEQVIPWDEAPILSDCEEVGDVEDEDNIDLDDFVYDDNQDKDKGDSTDSFENMENKESHNSHNASPEKRKKDGKSPGDEEKKYEDRREGKSVPLSDRGVADNQKNQIYSQGDLVLPKEYEDVANQSTKLTPVNNSYSGNNKDNSTIQASKDKVKFAFSCNFR
jgi:kinesin family member 18/19